VINKKLKSLPLAEAQRLLPGWEKHNNKLGTLVEHYLELEIPKGDQGSDWGARPLAAHQIIYAATDVAVLPYLAARTREISEALGVSAEVEARIKYVKQKVHKRAGRERKDDFERVSAALLRSLDRAEIDAVWQASRRMTLSAASTKEIQKLYQRRLAAVDN
jgi:ribonuclease D